ncbi:hypothetical protein Vadar_011384 [Vaccinium darrowii]|uniref:Uncharacterized protein n=1 Tax=Vaccinium darrowii TaxID=229202 RepID=A0ACB7Y6G1_9ERIC|nr:hypothetical protein Vadar_011384 [Vaccinium darrowii]
MKKKARSWVATYARNSIYEVSNGVRTYVVDLTMHSCICRKWDVTDIPCSHGIIAIMKDKRAPESFVHPFFHKETYKTLTFERICVLFLTDFHSDSDSTFLIVTLCSLHHSMSDDQEPLLIIDGSSTDESHFLNPKGREWWVTASLNVFFLLSGQTIAVILCRYYYEEGGNSTWMATLIQTAAFPILLIPYFILPSSQNRSTTSGTPPSIVTVSSVYLALGVVIAGDNMLYSIGLLYLSASTFSLISATQLVFNAIFSFFINSQKFTALVLNSVVVLTLSASLVGVNSDSDSPSGVSKWNYFLGFVSTIAAAALYSLLLSLMQLSFQKILKTETFSMVLEMQIFISLVATCVSVVGLFASGEWKTLEGEMDGFGTGRVAYVMTLVGTALAWQVCSVGVIGLIFVVSSLFSNFISTLSLAITPIAAVIVFHDAMNGVKVIALLLSLWGFSTYIYQNYLDDLKVKIMQTEVNEASNDTNC